MRLHLRLRTVASLRVLDIVCSSILGRQGSSRPLRPSDAYAGHVAHMPSTHRALALNANHELLAVLEAIVDKMADDGKLSVDLAEHFLRLLRDWSFRLSPTLRQRPCASTTAAREAIISNIHVAGVYYFATILVTRQFLAQHTMPQLRRHEVTIHSVDDPSTLVRIAELSTACVDAAIYMVEMCREALDDELLPGNMCILKYVLNASPASSFH